MPSDIACAHMIFSVGDFHLVLCNRGRQSSGEDLNLWLVQIWASFVLTGGDSVGYLSGVLYYVMLHVLNH